MNLKDINIIFESDKKDFDNKHKLNVSLKKVPESIINQINDGITSETLFDLQRQYPIFVYKTQVTIHGIFENSIDSYQYGYKNLIVNKNKSLGIKYNAIDECKRQKIKESLSHVGFNYGFLVGYKL